MVDQRAGRAKRSLIAERVPESSAFGDVAAIFTIFGMPARCPSRHSPAIGKWRIDLANFIDVKHEVVSSPAPML